MIKLVTVASLVTFAVACTTTVSGIHVQAMQVKIVPPLPPNCPLQMVSVGAAEMMPNAEFGPGGKYEMVGSISVEAPAGTDPMSPELRDQVRPEACRLGGAAVSLVVNGTQAFQMRRSFVTTTQQTLAFMVWAPRSTKSPQSIAF